MEQQWRLNVREKQGKEADRGLFLQAIVVLVRQLEQAKHEQQADEPDSEVGR
jgi:hypothetical protein